MTTSTAVTDRPHPNPRVEILLEQIDALQSQLGDRDADALVAQHIKLLHTYNEIKDGAQALIGRYAVMTGATVTAVHQELGLSLTE